MLFLKVLIPAILINTTYAYVFDVLRVNKAGGKDSMIYCVSIW